MHNPFNKVCIVCKFSLRRQVPRKICKQANQFCHFLCHLQPHTNLIKEERLLRLTTADMNGSLPILVVHREPASLEALFKPLRNYGYQVLTAASAKLALKLTHEQRAGLVLLAINGLSPEETAMCQQIRIEAVASNIPVVIFPCAPSVASIVENWKLGPNEYMVNGANTDELRTKIHMTVRLEQALAVLRESQQRQRQLVEILPAGMMLSDPQGRLRDVNRQAIALLGYTSRASLLAQNLFKLSRSQDHARLRADIAAVLKDGSLRKANYQLLKESGEVCEVELTADVWHDAKRQANGLVILVRDVSGQKSAENRARELLEILNQTQDAIIVRDLEGTIHYANEGVQRLFEWKEEELCGRNVRTIFFDNPRDFDAAQKELRRRGEWDGELHLMSKSRRPLIVQARWTSMRGVNGEPKYVVAVSTDVTERKHTEQSLREREQISHEIIDSALHGFWMVDLRGELQDVNAAYCRMTGYTRKELLRKHVSDLDVGEPSRKLMLRHIQRLVRMGSERFETRHRRKDGSTFAVEVNATYLQLGGGYLFAFLNDITERQQLDEERRHLSQQILAAQEAERARVGRELHDGVNQIIASARMRLRNVQQHANSLGPADRAILYRCDQLLAQALDENRRIARNLHPGDLDQIGLPEACLKLCKELASRTSLKVKSTVPRKWPRLIPTAELCLFRIVQEGLNNVEQHAEAKSVRLQLEVQDSGLVLKIRDDGGGFDSHAPKTKGQKRHGIGLANMRERATSLGGTCAVVSTPKRGTTITVRVPSGSIRSLVNCRRISARRPEKPLQPPKGTESQN